VERDQETASVRRVMVSARHETRPSQQQHVPKLPPVPSPSLRSQGLLRSQGRIANHSHARMRVRPRISGRRVNRAAISQMMMARPSRDWAITCRDS
jgi:hypothetical protein